MALHSSITDAYKGVSKLLESNQKVVSLKYTLNNGTLLPIVGYGTYKVHSSEIYQLLDEALACGYRNIDTAAVYHNEAAIGEALKQLLPKHSLKREDIYITTKLSPRDMGKVHIQKAVDQALRNLNTDYIDLFLIHWPGAQGLNTDNFIIPQLRLETWQEMIRLHDGGRGVLRAIGVSNFLAKHVEQIVIATGVPPAVNQVEFHPYFNHPKELYEISVKHNTLLQAYSSLGGSGNPDLLKHRVVQQCAEKHKTSPAQVLLRWALQCGYAVLPKSVTLSKIKMNSELEFVLDKNDMDALNAISSSEGSQKFAWNPDNVI